MENQSPVHHRPTSTHRLPQKSWEWASSGTTAARVALLHHLARSKQPTAQARAKLSEAKPHLVFLLADDLGYNDLSFQHEAAADIRTPHIDELTRSGLRLTRHYAFKTCSPSRSALLSGREPHHVTVLNALPWVIDTQEPFTGYSQGVPYHMTGWGELMMRAGYETVFAGKWDAGMATHRHMPRGRGFAHALSFFHHSNDYWTLRVPRLWCGVSSNTTAGRSGVAWQDQLNPAAAKYFKEDAASSSNNRSGSSRLAGVAPIDLWLDSGPAPESYLSPQPRCAAGGRVPWPRNASGCMYEEDLFLQHVLSRVEAWQSGKAPLFILWAFHAVHSPYQVPSADFEALPSSPLKNRRSYAATVNRMDAAIGTLVGALERKGMWAKTLMVFTNDNGGALSLGCCASNYPLRGGKSSHFDGGIRVPAVVSGGFLPLHRRGKTVDELVTLWDWYATFAHLGGLNPDQVRDYTASVAGLPRVDSIDVSSLLLGDPPAELASAPAKPPPRVEIPLGDCANVKENKYCDVSRSNAEPGATVVSGLIAFLEGHLYKLLLGWQALDCVTPASYPDGSKPSCPWRWCGTVGCLYNLSADESESHDLVQSMSASSPDHAPDAPGRQLAAGRQTPVRRLLAEMHRRIGRHNATALTLSRGSRAEAVDDACAAALLNYGGTWGPFVSAAYLRAGSLTADTTRWKLPKLPKLKYTW